MSSISPMTPGPPAASPSEPPVVSLQQRLADRLADRLAQKAPAEPPPASVRKKKEPTGEELMLPGVAMPQPVRTDASEAFAGGAMPLDERGQAGMLASVPHDAGVASSSAALADPSAGSAVLSARLGTELPVGLSAEPQVPGSGDTPVEARTESPELAAMVVPGTAARSEPAATVITAPLTEAKPTAPRWLPDTPAQVASAPASASTGREGGSVTVAFQSWGPGHDVRAQWAPGGGVLVPGSERVGMALSAVASQPGGVSIAGEHWRVERTDADAEQRERPRHDTEQDA